jgi:hypothetical protein
MAKDCPPANDGATVAAVDRLCHALERVGDALVAVDGDALLAAEIDLSAAAATFAMGPDAGDRGALLDAVRRTRGALLRCRRLGASISGISRAMNRAGRDADVYDRAGGYVENGSVHSSVQVRA